MLDIGSNVDETLHNICTLQFCFIFGFGHIHISWCSQIVVYTKNLIYLILVLFRVDLDHVRPVLSWNSPLSILNNNIISHKNNWFAFVTALSFSLISIVRQPWHRKCIRISCFSTCIKILIRLPYTANPTSMVGKPPAWSGMPLCCLVTCFFSSIRCT